MRVIKMTKTLTKTVTYIKFGKMTTLEHQPRRQHTHSDLSEHVTWLTITRPTIHIQ